jgi:hypothetical protein
MELLKLCICGDVYEFEVVENYLQRTLGTFINNHGWDKLKRENWDNAGFFNYQSKPVFTVWVESFRRKVNVTIAPTKEEIADAEKLMEDTYGAQKTGEEIELLTKRYLKDNAKKEEKQFRIKHYCTVSAYFLDGEWHWKTKYDERDIHQSMKNETCKPYLTRYVYTGDELGLCGKMPSEDVFAALFD